MRAELFVAVVLALATTEAAEDDYICKTSIEVQYTAPAAGEILGPIVLGAATSTSFRPFLAHFSAPPHPARALCYALLSDHAGRVLIGACNPML